MLTHVYKGKRVKQPHLTFLQNTWNSDLGWLVSPLCSCLQGAVTAAARLCHQHRCLLRPGTRRHPRLEEASAWTAVTSVAAPVTPLRSVLSRAQCAPLPVPTVRAHQSKVTADLALQDPHTCLAPCPRSTEPHWIQILINWFNLPLACLLSLSVNSIQSWAGGTAPGPQSSLHKHLPQLLWIRRQKCSRKKVATGKRTCCVLHKGSKMQQRMRTIFYHKRRS